MTREKVVVDLAPGEPSTAELLWARKVGDDQYELENVPIWAYGLALGDVVEAPILDDQRRHFKKLLRRSGLLTVRAAGPDSDREVLGRLYDVLKRNAVATERFSPSYAAFAMEPAVFAQLEKVVNEAERAGPIVVEIANEDS
jgi:hypothetical protein